jgi:branched-chain amino acid aminotransferase
MKILINLEKDYIPRGVDNFMYIRPTYISMTDQLGVLPASSAKLFIIMSTILPKETNPIKVYCPEEITKKYPQSFGHLNIGSNLGPILEQLKIVREKGYDDLLFLLNDNITELSDMNVFVFWENENGKKELVTPGLDGSVLPGITRDSIIKITKDMGIDVTERHISIKELINAINSNKMLEIFGASTMNGITSIEEIHYNNQTYILPGDFRLNKRTEFCQNIHESLMKIKVGEEGHSWITTLE